MALTRLRWHLLSFKGSQKDLARVTGISEPVMSRYANGKLIPYDHLMLIAAVLNVEPYDLVGFMGDDEEDAIDVL